MSTKKKITVICLVVALVAALVVGTTLAYFTDSDINNNAFAVGDVKIKLNETPVNEYGEPKSEDRVKQNNYLMVPNHTYVKDPTTTIEAKSEDCYVRMLVQVNNLDGLKNIIPKSEYPGWYYGDLFKLQNLVVDEHGICTWVPTEWKSMGLKSGTTDTYEFRYIGIKSTDGVVPKAASDTVLSPLFTDFTIPSFLDNDDIASLIPEEGDPFAINVTAEAIQADTFEDADDAWKAFDAQNASAE